MVEACPICALAGNDGHHELAAAASRTGSLLLPELRPLFAQMPLITLTPGGIFRRAALFEAMPAWLDFLDQRELVPRAALGRLRARAQKGIHKHAPSLGLGLADPEFKATLARLGTDRPTARRWGWTRRAEAESPAAPPSMC